MDRPQAQVPESLLPPAFAALEPLVARWAVATEEERANKRTASSMEDLRSLHEAVMPRFDEIVAWLNRFPNDPEALPETEKNLFRLAQMAMEAAGPIDLEWRTPDIEDVFPMERFRFHEPY